MQRPLLISTGKENPRFESRGRLAEHLELSV